MRKEIFDKIHSGFVFLMLIVMLCGIANTALNTHIHVLSNGEIIVHAHPVKSCEKTHCHSDSEFLALYTIESERASTHTFIFFVACHLFKFEQTLYLQTPEVPISGNINGRAPPAFT